MTPPATGHPRGLYTLFFTEMWERLSFYGMRALLVLFMVDQVAKGGLGLTDETATAIYGIYTAGVYLAALPGGWIADRLLGSQRAILAGGVLIAAGHFVLGIPAHVTFYLGLVLVVLGTGLLKPNISTLVGQLYPEGGARRDAGFTVFYMGINLGGAIGPLVCSTLGENEKIGWHWGFAAAGVGMVLGLVQFVLTRHHLGDIGGPPPAGSRVTLAQWLILAAGILAAGILTLVVFLAAGLAGFIRLDAVGVAQSMTWVILAMAVCYFAWVFLLAGLTGLERRRVAVILVLFVASALFWAGFEQSGSSLNLFAERHTLRIVPLVNREIPAGWFQSLNAVFVIGLAPLMAGLWVALDRRQRAPSLTAKFAWGLLLLSIGFAVFAVAARLAVTSERVWPHWLVLTYLLHTVGELCLSPVGLSAVTKLSPPRLVGQMMGVWFVATSLGNLLAGLIAGSFSGKNVAAMPRMSLTIALVAGAAGLVLLVLARPIRRFSGDVE